MRCRAKAGDRDSFAFKIRGRFNLRPNHQSLQARLHWRSHEHAIGASKGGSDNRVAPAHGELNLARDQRTYNARCAAAYNYDLCIDAMLFEEPFFFGDPYTAGGRADGAKTDANFVDRKS